MMPSSTVPGYAVPDFILAYTTYAYCVYFMKCSVRNNIIITVVLYFKMSSYVICFRYLCLISNCNSLVLELMDYPDSDEEGDGQAMGVNPNILDTEDMDVAPESVDKPEPVDSKPGPVKHHRDNE